MRSLTTLSYFFRQKYPQHYFLTDPLASHYIVLTLSQRELLELQRGLLGSLDICKFELQEAVGEI